MPLLETSERHGLWVLLTGERPVGAQRRRKILVRAFQIVGLLLYLARLPRGFRIEPGGK